MDVTTILTVAGPTTIFVAGAAWGGAKVALNGTRNRVKMLEEESKTTTDRLARIETKIDILLENKK